MDGLVTLGVTAVLLGSAVLFVVMSFRHRDPRYLPHDLLRTDRSVESAWADDGGTLDEQATAGRATDEETIDERADGTWVGGERAINGRAIHRDLRGTDSET